MVRSQVAAFLKAENRAQNNVGIKTFYGYGSGRERTESHGRENGASDATANHARHAEDERAKNHLRLQTQAQAGSVTTGTGSARLALHTRGGGLRQMCRAGSTGTLAEPHAACERFGPQSTQMQRSCRGHRREEAPR